MAIFKNVAELVELAESRGQKIHEIMLEQEVQLSGRSPEELTADMGQRFRVMKEAAQEGFRGVVSHSGLSGGNAKKMADYLEKGKLITDSGFVSALAYALATNEVNAAMGIICATPTAGSSGVLPGVLLSMQEKFALSDECIVQHLFTAGAFGYIIANNAMISGAAGGCQAEVGSASAMAAAALTEMLGGSPSQAAHAAAMALKSLLGLTCDPVAGLVEVPCVKRNAAGAAMAIAAAEMALAGVESYVPCDEVISALYRIGLSIHVSLRETSQGGLAATPTGEQWREALL